MRATSQEIREQIIEAKSRGEKEETIIKWTKVSRSTITKVWSRYQNTGDGLAKANTGRKSKITPEIEEQIRLKIAEKNDITLEELIEELDLPIKKSQLSKLLILWELSYKKRLYTLKNNSVKMSKKREKNGLKPKKI